MKTATTRSEASSLKKTDVFDLDGAYQDHIDNILADDRQGHFHPSMVGMCGRRNVYEFIRAPQDLNATSGESREIFDLGHAVHDIVQSRMEAMDVGLAARGITFRFQREVPHDPATDWLRQDFGIGGTCDGILEIEGDGWKQRGVLEVKSIGDSSYNQLSGPKAEHVDQAHLYALRFDCPIIWIWYYNKNKSTRRVFTVIFDPDRAERILQKYTAWLDHVRAGTLPDREESRFMCPECPYLESCKPSIQGLQLRRKTTNATVRRNLRAFNTRKSP